MSPSWPSSWELSPPSSSNWYWSAYPGLQAFDNVLQRDVLHICSATNHIRRRFQSPQVAFLSEYQSNQFSRRLRHDLHLHRSISLH